MGAVDRKRSRKFASVMRLAGFGVLIALSLSVCILAVLYAFRPLPHKSQSPYLEGLYVHIFASVFALALGPFQFSSRLRRTRIRLHRWLGRLYLGVGVLAGGVSGLFIAFYSPNQFSIRLSFACLAVAWLYTGLHAYRTIRARDIEGHRRWMLRNFALTFASVTFKITRALLFLGLGLSDGRASELAAWLCWIPNLLIVEMWINRPRRSFDAIATGSSAMSLESSAGPE